MTNILELHGITKAYTQKGTVQHILSGIDLAIAPGECVGLVGRSGCGKSTLVKIVSRLLDADDGTILFAGKNVTRARGKDLRALYDRLQVIFQLPQESFDPRQTLGWSIAEPLLTHGVAKNERRETVRSLLAQVGLPQTYENRYPHEVSGGECQRAAIARALALSPAFLICDEATSALDATVQQDILALLRQLMKERHMACLFVTHDLALLPHLAKRTIVLSGGRLAEIGPTEELIAQPQSAATQELLQAVCQLQGDGSCTMR